MAIIRTDGENMTRACNGGNKIFVRDQRSLWVARSSTCVAESENVFSRWGTMFETLSVNAMGTNFDSRKEKCGELNTIAWETE